VIGTREVVYGKDEHYGMSIVITGTVIMLVDLILKVQLNRSYTIFCSQCSAALRDNFPS
jgi:predicted nucleic-acid-binding Zn-ribbon protein